MKDATKQKVDMEIFIGAQEAKNTLKMQLHKVLLLILHHPLINHTRGFRTAIENIYNQTCIN